MNSERCLAFIGVSCIILGQYSSYAYFLTQVFSFTFPLVALILFVLLSTLVLMIFWAYSFAVFKDPGYLSVEADDRIGITEEEIEESRAKSFRMKEKVVLNFPDARVEQKVEGKLEQVFVEQKRWDLLGGRTLVFDEENGGKNLEIDGKSVGSERYHFSGVYGEIG